MEELLGRLKASAENANIPPDGRQFALVDVDDLEQVTVALGKLGRLERALADDTIAGNDSERDHGIVPAILMYRDEILAQGEN